MGELNRIYKYDRVASDEELFELEHGMHEYTLRQISARGEIYVDEMTFYPFIVYQNVRYNIEPIVEQQIPDNRFKLH